MEPEHGCQNHYISANTSTVQTSQNIFSSDLIWPLFITHVQNKSVFRRHLNMFGILVNKSRINDYRVTLKLLFFFRC